MTLSRQHNSDLSNEIQQIEILFKESKETITSKLEIISKEKTEEEQLRYMQDDDLKEKDHVIKTLTQDNLTLKARLTQIE